MWCPIISIRGGGGGGDGESEIEKKEIAEVEMMPETPWSIDAGHVKWQAKKKLAKQS